MFRPLEENKDDYDLAWAMYMGYAFVVWKHDVSTNAFVLSFETTMLHSF